MRHLSSFARQVAVGVLLAACASTSFGLKFLKKHEKSSEQLRADYISRLQGTYVAPVETPTVGSLWSSQSFLSDFATDYKARHLNDTITIVVSVQTTAAQSGSVDSSRSFSNTSSITGIMGQSTSATDPLFASSSSRALKGSGATASNTTFQTSLTGQVIAVLPNGNLVVEAQREIYMNNQHENVLVRGLLRPGDIGPANTVSSASLSNLEIEMKGKGIIADSTKPPGVLTKVMLWLFNF
jgi:flagellar L-ring protein precursor FlgH